MEEPILKFKSEATKFIMEIEVTCCLNLAHCYNKVDQYHHAIKYCKQALEKVPENKKALFRLGVAYTNIGELERARETLNTVVELTEDQA